jgi:hypothetical protein
MTSNGHGHDPEGAVLHTDHHDPAIPLKALPSSKLHAIVHSDCDCYSLQERTQAWELFQQRPDFPRLMGLPEPKPGDPLVSTLHCDRCDHNMVVQFPSGDPTPRELEVLAGMWRREPWALAELDQAKADLLAAHQASPDCGSPAR